MTPEMLKMYEKLQKKFKGKGWKRQPGDWFYNKKSKTLLNCGADAILIHKDIWLPLPIDPVNPERGLWGMVDWKSYELITTSAGELAIWGRTMKRSICTSPTEALLKVLMAQEGL